MESNQWQFFQWVMMHQQNISHYPQNRFTLDIDITSHFYKEVVNS